MSAFRSEWLIVGWLDVSNENVLSFVVSVTSEAPSRAETIWTGSTTKTTMRTSVPALRQTIFSETSRISPIPSGRSCGAGAVTGPHTRNRVGRLASCHGARSRDGRTHRATGLGGSRARDPADARGSRRADADPGAGAREPHPALRDRPRQP